MIKRIHTRDPRKGNDVIVAGHMGKTFFAR